MNRTSRVHVAAVLLAVPVAALCAAAAHAAPAESEQWVERLPIVDRAIEHHGGSAYTASETTLRLCSKGGCFRLVVTSDGGRFTHDVTREEDGLRVRVTNDTVELWENGVAKTVPKEDEERRRRFVSARVYFVFLPYRLNDPGVQKLDLGVVNWLGRPLHKVRVRFGSRPAGGDEGAETGQTSDEYMYWFDPETGEVAYFAYDFVGDPSGLRFRRAVDYRRIGGILFFDQENVGLDGDGLDVGDVDPVFVIERLPPISRVRLREIVVKPLPPSSPAN